LKKKRKIKKTLVFGVITVNDSIFGEISFLEGTAATASVVANEPDTVVRVLESYYLDVLFDYYPGLSGRFYHYLATVLATRLKLRESAAQGGKTKDEEESELEDDDKISKNSIIARTQNSDAKKKKKRKSFKRTVAGGEEDLIRERKETKPKITTESGEKKEKTKDKKE